MDADEGLGRVGCFYAHSMMELILNAQSSVCPNNKMALYPNAILLPNILTILTEAKF